MVHGVAAVAVVTHKRTGLTHSEEIVDGKYSLTFPEYEKKLMADGDKLIIDIRNVNKTILFGSYEHILTQAEIDAGSLKVPNITTNRVSEFTITGKITNGQRNPIEGAIVSALSREYSTAANGEYSLALTDYATNPVAGDEFEVFVTAGPPIFPVVQLRKKSFLVEDIMLQNRGVEDINVSITHILIGGLNLDRTQYMNVPDKAIARAGVPVRIRDYPYLGTEAKEFFEEHIFSHFLGAMDSLIRLSLTFVSLDTPQQVVEQWQNMYVGNFGNPIVPYSMIGMDYLEDLTKAEGEPSLKIVGNKLDLYLVAPDADDISVESGLGASQIIPIAPDDELPPYIFQLDEEMIFLTLGEESSIDSVTLYYCKAEFEAPEYVDIYESLAMEYPDTDGIWTASVELERNSKYFYFFEVQLKEPMTMVVGGEPRQVKKWFMNDPKNIQLEDRGLFSKLFMTAEWLEAFRPVLEALLNGEPIPPDAIPQITDYLMAKSHEIIADMLNPESPNYLDPQIVSEFKTPSVADGEILWLVHFDVDAHDGDYEITINMKDVDGNSIDYLNVQIGVDRSFAPVIYMYPRGEVNRALSLDGEGDWVELTDFAVPEAFTVEMWVNPHSISDGQCFIGKQTIGGDNIFLVGYWDGSVHVRVRSDAHTEGEKIRGFHHLAVVVEETTSSSVTVYRNGNLLWQTTLADTIGNTTGKPWVLGHLSLTDFFNGIIDEVRLWGSARTQEQIQATMKTTLTGRESGLIGYWNFDDGTANDFTANGNHGMLMGDADIIPLGTWPPPLYGDVTGDGTVSALDAAKILQYIVGLIDELPIDSLTSPGKGVPRDYVISLPQLSAKVGEGLHIPIAVDDATGLTAGGITIKYDQNVLKALDFAPTSLLNGFYWKANIDRVGEVRFAFANAKPAIGKGELLRIEFEVLPRTEGHISPIIFDNVQLAESLTIITLDGSVTICPSITALLPNYPNPFNPDTWLPYHLAQDALVTINIYNVKGQLVRTLNLGNKNASVYATKSKAAYWDGKDSFGEKVSSGVYFYTLQAGEFRATRKMVIMK